MRAWNRFIWVWRHLLFWTRCPGILNGRSTLWKRSYQERWKNVTKSHTFLLLWIFFVCVESSDENILLIKVRTERDKGPKMWSLAFDLPKFKMFSGEDKRCRLVSRCWSFIVINHGISSLDTRPFLRCNFWIWTNSAGPQASNYFKWHGLFFLFTAAWGFRL